MSQEKNEIFLWLDIVGEFDVENAIRNPQLSLKITFHFYMQRKRLPHHRDSLFFYNQVLEISLPT